MVKQRELVFLRDIPDAGSIDHRTCDRTVLRVDALIDFPRDQALLQLPVKKECQILHITHFQKQKAVHPVRRNYSDPLIQIIPCFFLRISHMIHRDPSGLTPHFPGHKVHHVPGDLIFLIKERHTLPTV